ncbi:MAG: glutathione synthase, partial [Azoarcus sp.]|nr:glutathione synthase [Azoarcus sp.]
MKALNLAFIVDPLAELKAYKDSSVAMMRAATVRGHVPWAIRREDIIWRDGLVLARAE